MVNASVEKAASPATAPLEGRLLVDIAEERGVTPADVMFDVAVDDKLETFFRISGPVNVDESRLERILKSPATLVGHLRRRCPPADLRRRRLHELLPRALGAREGHVHASRKASRR